MDSILILINERSRSGEGAYSTLEKTLMDKGHRVIPLSESDKKKDFRILINEFKDCIKLIIVGGGDGTINYLLPTLVETQIPLIVFPLGTANLLARSFQLKADVEELEKLIHSGKIITIDLGKVNGLYFINVCGIGISTEVNGQISPMLKKLAGPLSFWITGLKLSPKLTSYKMKLSVDDKLPVFTRSWQITICNGKKYAAWMTIEPNASYVDQTLHCLSTEITRWWQGLRLFPCYLKGNYKETSEVTLMTGKRIKIETKHPMNVDVDGDIQTTTPALFEVVPRALKLVIPT